MTFLFCFFSPLSLFLFSVFIFDDRFIFNQRKWSSLLFPHLAFFSICLLFFKFFQVDRMEHDNRGKSSPIQPNWLRVEKRIGFFPMEESTCSSGNVKNMGKGTTTVVDDGFILLMESSHELLKSFDPDSLLSWQNINRHFYLCRVGGEWEEDKDDSSKNAIEKWPIDSIFLFFNSDTIGCRLTRDRLYSLWQMQSKMRISDYARVFLRADLPQRQSRQIHDHHHHYDRFLQIYFSYKPSSKL